MWRRLGNTGKSGGIPAGRGAAHWIVSPDTLVRLTGEAARFAAAVGLQESRSQKKINNDGEIKELKYMMLIWRKVTKCHLSASAVFNI